MFASKVAISGIGRSAIGRKTMTAPTRLLAEAFAGALADAGLSRSDIDGITTYPGRMKADTGMSPLGIPEAVNALGLKVSWHSNCYEGPGQASALFVAAMAVASGVARHVLVFRCLTESSAQATGRRGVGAGEENIGGWNSWNVPMGAVSPVNWAAFHADRIMYESGLKREQLGIQAVLQRENAQHDAKAIMNGKTLSLDEYLDARMISDPLCLFDCDVPIDGAVAVIVSDLQAARDCRKAPLRLLAIGAGLSEPFTSDQRHDMTTMAAHDAAASLWRNTDIKPADIDVAGLYDGFSIFVPMWLEALGFCNRGEGGPLIEAGGTRLDGIIPTNTGGGQLSGGRLHGYGHLFEVCAQLRQEAGNRQVAEARIGAVGMGGGPLAGALLLARD